MKLTKSLLRQIIQEELNEATSPENEVFSDIIDHHSMVLTSKMNSLVTNIYKELERQGLDRDSEQQMLLDAAKELNELRAQNPLANVVLEQLQFLASPAVLLKEIGGATEVFGE
jgi:hypothetical protein